jgi:hypothetical protein
LPERSARLLSPRALRLLRSSKTGLLRSSKTGLLRSSKTGLLRSPKTGLLSAPRCLLWLLGLLRRAPTRLLRSGWLLGLSPSSALLGLLRLPPTTLLRLRLLRRAPRSAGSRGISTGIPSSLTATTRIETHDRLPRVSEARDDGDNVMIVYVIARSANHKQPNTRSSKAAHLARAQSSAALVNDQRVRSALT